jgi:iron complex transport system substrate-binding protein
MTQLRTNRVAGALGLAIILLILVFLCGCSGSGSDYGINTTPGISEENKTLKNFTDSEGRVVSIPVPAKRIVALYSNSAEILVAIGAGDTIVGAADPVFASRPWLLKYMHNPVKVGAHFTPNCEQIVALHPDLVIALPSTRNYAEKIEDAGIPVLYLATDNIDDIVPAIGILGNVTGKMGAAENLTTFYQDNLNLVDTRLQNLSPSERPAVYMEMYSDFSAVSPGSASGELINRTGGYDVLRIERGTSSIVTPEWVVNESPNVIIRAVNTAYDPDIDLSPYYKRFTTTQGLNTTSAVLNHRVSIMTGEMLYGPRSFTGVLAMAKIMHPDLFQDVDPMQKLDEYADRFIPEARNSSVRIYPAI